MILFLHNNIFIMSEYKKILTNVFDNDILLGSHIKQNLIA